MESGLTSTATKAEKTVVRWTKSLFSFLYNPVIRNLAVAGLLACSVSSFIGYTMLVAQVDSAKAQTTLEPMQGVLNADATLTGQVFLLFGVGSLILACCVCGADLLVYIVSRFSESSSLNGFRNHRDWLASLNGNERNSFDLWWGKVVVDRAPPQAF